MKPMPTLTKPLRSVDTDSRAAQALRERTDSCAVPAAGVVAKAMVASCSPTPTGRSSAAIHRRVLAAADAVSRSGTDGNRPRRLHGGGQVAPSPGRSPRRVEGRARQRRADRTRLGSGRAGARAPRRGRCSGQPRAARRRAARGAGADAVIALGGGSVLWSVGAGGARGPRRGVARGRPGEPGGGSPETDAAARPLAAQRSSRTFRPSAQALYEELPRRGRRRPPDRGRRGARARCPRCRRRRPARA